MTLRLIIVLITCGLLCKFTNSRAAALGIGRCRVNRSTHTNCQRAKQERQLKIGRARLCCCLSLIEGFAIIFVLKSLWEAEGGTLGRYLLANRNDSNPPASSGHSLTRGGKNYRLTLLNERGTPGNFLECLLMFYGQNFFKVVRRLTR